MSGQRRPVFIAKADAPNELFKSIEYAIWVLDVKN
jgi:hypothetical protein